MKKPDPISFEESQIYWGEILDMCYSPKIGDNIEVVIVDNPKNPKRHSRTGSRGISKTI